MTTPKRAYTAPPREQLAWAAVEACAKVGVDLATFYREYLVPAERERSETRGL